MVTAQLATIVLAPRFGSRPLVPAGMLLAALGMLILTRLGLHSTYVGGVLPALVPLGLGLGLIFAPSISAATAGVRRTTPASPRRWSTRRSRSAARSAPRS